MEQTVSKAKPHVLKGTRMVVAWEFDVTVQDREAKAMDSFHFEVPPAFQKPLEDWTRRDLMRFIEGCLNQHPTYARLLQILTQRRDREEVADYNVETMAA